MRHSTTPIWQGLAQVLRQQVRALAGHVEGARRGSVRDVHQARVASRRLREALPVAVRAVPGAGAASARVRVRRLTVALGGVRELDVARETFQAECTRHGWRLPVVRRIQQHLDRERRRCGRRMREQLARVDVPRLETAIATLASALDADQSRAWSPVLGARLRRRAERFGEALDDVGTLYAADRLHAVRIAAKKLRYTLELSASAGRLPVGREIAMLKRVQQLLGRLHDLQILQSHVQAVAAAAASEVRLRRALDEILAVFEAECRGLHARFLGRRPALAQLPGRAKAAAAPWRAAKGRARR